MGSLAVLHLAALGAVLAVPKVDVAPKLEDFVAMEPEAALTGGLARVDQFIQRAPDDGAPATERTAVYVGYDASRLYVIFVAFDREPEKIRARLDRREAITLDEDAVGFYVDTFDDGRRAYQFECNAIGIQDDSV